ncbi:MAG TPA: SMR family transporter [Chthonomonadaceae bacterium]|nr:SMR family transporter [Chthonomonadaceae bacterium]
MSLLLNTAAALSYVIGGVFMKLSTGLSRPGPSLMVFLCFCTGAGLQAFAMRKAEMGVAYILVLGLEAVLAFTVGAVFFREDRSLWKLLGVGLVVVGILLLHHEG